MTQPKDDWLLITSLNARQMGQFARHQKKTTTIISDFTVPPGTPFETPEGLKAEDEPCRIAFDIQGGVYPIRESVYRATYSRLGFAKNENEEDIWKDLPSG